MARVLVTGATGFIGEQLVRALLAQGDQVRCLVRGTSQIESLQSLGVELTLGDVTDSASLPPALNGIDTVYHAAALTKASGLAAYCRVNEAGVRHLAAACARCTTPPVMVMVSSLAAAGAMSDRNQLRTENDPIHPISHYGLSKRAGEIAAENYAGEVPHHRSASAHCAGPWRPHRLDAVSQHPQCAVVRSHWNSPPSFGRACC